MIRTFIGLGANLAEPLTQLRQAVQALSRLPGSRLVACSPLYQSSPMGPADQPDYLNAVAALDTALAPHALLDELQRIEREQGRVRKAERWGPRTLDLDLLLYGSLSTQDARLTLPHYGMKSRAFVLLPLADLAPELVLPCGTSLAELVARCDRTGLHRLPLPLFQEESE